VFFEDNVGGVEFRVDSLGWASIRWLKEFFVWRDMKTCSGRFFECGLDHFDNIPIIQALNLVGWCGILGGMMDSLTGYANRHWRCMPAILAFEDRRGLVLMRVKSAGLALSRKGMEFLWFEVGRKEDVLDELVEFPVQFEVGEAHVPLHEEKSRGIGKRGVVFVRRGFICSKICRPPWLRRCVCFVIWLTLCRRVAEIGEGGKVVWCVGGYFAKILTVDTIFVLLSLDNTSWGIWRNFWLKRFIAHIMIDGGFEGGCDRDSFGRKFVPISTR
jgi:hypothetical protein